MAPILPLISEKIYIGLNGNIFDGSISVHLTDFPLKQVNEITINQSLVSVIDQIVDICSNALFIRNTQHIRIRQPLSKLTIVTQHNTDKLIEFTELIKDEVNVKEVRFSQDVEQYATSKISFNFKLLGARIPEKVKEIIIANNKNEWQLQDNGNLLIANIKIFPQEFSIVLEPKIQTTIKSLSDNQGLIFFDLDITEDLRLEGLARDLVRIIQEARKDAALHVSDRIIIEICSEDKSISLASSQYADMISEQCLAQYGVVENHDYMTKTALSESHIVLKIARV